jgi:hypothetical protein
MQRMTTPSIDSLINLTAALITLVAVIVPIAFNIWRKAKETNSTYKILSIIFAVFAFLSYGSGGFVWLSFDGPNLAVVALYSAGLIFHIGYFLIQKSPITRASIVLLVFQSVMVAATIPLYFVGRLLSLIEKHVG